MLLLCTATSEIGFRFSFSGFLFEGAFFGPLGAYTVLVPRSDVLREI